MDVTAFLSTSVIVSVTGALGVPSIPAENVALPVTSSAHSTALVGVETARSEPSAPIAAVDPAGLRFGVPSPFVGPEPVAGRTPTETLARLTGVALLGQLALLSRTQLAAFAAEHPEKIEELLTTPPAAADVAIWWEETSASDRLTLSAATPSLVGNLEGLPYRARDLANRRLLDQTEDSIRAQLEAGVGRAVSDELEGRLHMLGEVAEALETGESGEYRSLVGLDVTGEGRAIIAIGDISEADNVTFLVPGMYYGVASQLVDWTNTADALVAEQQEWVERLDSATSTTVAAVAWIGYHTPTLVTVASLELAREGQAALTATLQGLAAERGDDQPYVAVLAHSYGSTAVMLSLQEDDVEIDALAVVGSPGSPAQTVDELNVRSGNVWVGAAEWDPIPGSGVFGSQPLSADYGAHRFAVSSMDDPMSGTELGDSASHNDYFATGSSSMRNMALIGLDRADLVLGTNGGLALGPGRALAR